MSEEIEIAPSALTRPSAANGQQLLAMARDRSIAGRKSLASTVATMVASRGADFTEDEQTLASDILRTLIRDVERSVRAALAANLAASAAAPRDVILALANDEIEIAFPILAESPLLDDEELSRIVLDRASGHRIAIAMRPGLSATVSDALIESSDQEAIVCLLHNAEADISEPGMTQLVETARRLKAYQDPLAARDDLSPSLALRLAGAVAQSLQDVLIARFKLDPDAVRAAAADAIEDAALALVNEAGPPPDELGAKRRDVRQMIEILRRSEWPHFEAAMVRFTGLPPRLVHTILTERDGRRLTVLCRASGVHKSDFASLYLLSRRATPDVEIVDASDVREALALFDGIARPAAGRAVGRWKVKAQEDAKAHRNRLH